ncbi:MAG: EVE domain-containing protein [Gammaproteobacteria bacterium]|nr:EVE domain-containing protein [Gammaproteobacteria bacterium]
MRYWLMKSEPSVFGLTHLKASPRRTTMWDGVRNYQARNMLRDDFKKGDLAFFYHSSCPEPGIVAVIEILCPGYPDPTAFMRAHPHHDPKSKRDTPRWFAVDVKLKTEFEERISLEELKRTRELSDMIVLRRGNRLSITPVSDLEWRFILAMR